MMRWFTVLSLLVPIILLGLTQYAASAPNIHCTHQCVLCIAYEQQEDLNKIMKNFFNDPKEVMKTKEGEQDLYRFVGPKVGKMSSKLANKMMQSYGDFIEEKAKMSFQPGTNDYIADLQRIRLIEHPMGGENIRIGFSIVPPHNDPDNWDSGAILIHYDNKLVEYEELFAEFENSGIADSQIAKLILEAGEKPLNNQPIWDHLDDSKLKRSMVLFAAKTQIAEGAQPTAEFFERLHEAFDSYFDELMYHIHMKIWRAEFSEFLSGDKYLYDTSLDEADEAGPYIDHNRYFDLFSLINKAKPLHKEIKNTRQELKNWSLTNETRNQLSEELFKHESILYILRKDISQNLPKHNEEFYQKLIEKRSEGDCALKQFLLGKDFDTTSDHYIADLKGSIDQLVHLPVDEWNNKTGIELKRKIETHLPPIAENFLIEAYKFKNLTKRIETLETTAMGMSNRLKKLDDIAKKFNDMSKKFYYKKEKLNDIVRKLNNMAWEFYEIDSETHYEIIKTLNYNVLELQALATKLTNESNEFKSLAKKLSDADQTKKYDNETGRYYPNGGIPGAGVLARGLLKDLSEGRISSFREFSRKFVHSEKGGLRKAYEYHFQHSYEAWPEERFAEELDKFQNQIEQILEELANKSASMDVNEPSSTQVNGNEPSSTQVNGNKPSSTQVNENKPSSAKMDGDEGLTVAEKIYLLFCNIIPVFVLCILLLKCLFGN